MSGYKRSSAFGHQNYLLYALTCQWIWGGGEGGGGGCIVKIAPGGDQNNDVQVSSIN